jgi:uncharacterized Zn finger protein
MSRRRSSYYDDYWPQYTSTSPITVRDGLKAKSQRGTFVKSWWGNRWIAALTQLMDSGRLSRGRSYARRGQVLEINVQPGQIAARVQGSRRTPYRVSIHLKPLTGRQWDKVLDALAEQALFAAQLLNGEMPPDIEQVFDAAQVPLFPSSRGDLETDCSCPDWANPCKHIAAVYYLLGERFDENPFLLFELRGRSQEQIAAALRERRAQGVEAVSESQTPYSAHAIQATPQPRIDENLDHYWSLGGSVHEMGFRIHPPQVEMALLKRLGVPEHLDARTFWAQMQRVYDGVSAHALDIAFSDEDEAT